MSGDEPEDPGPIWEHLPGPPSAFVACWHGLVTVFGQPRKLVAVVVLLGMLLVPVLPLVSVWTGSFLTTFVVLALLPVTYLRRDDATIRVSLTWLVGVLVLSVGLNMPWTGIVLWWVMVPLAAIPAAAWAVGSWRRGATSIVELFRHTWIGAIGALVLATWVLGLLVALVVVSTSGFEQAPRVVWGVVGTSYLVVVTAFGIGYAQVALDRAEAAAPADGIGPLSPP